MLDSNSNIISYLFKEYVKENTLTVGVIAGLSVVIALIQTHGINVFVAKLIECTKGNSKGNIWNIFYILCGLYILYQGLYYVFYEFQDSVKEWDAREVVEP